MAAQNKSAPKEYGADSIKVLEGLEAVRKRPGMYIGSTGERGLHHLVWEVVDNAVDEAMAGFASKVEVRLLENGGVQVTDDGRGIPVAMHATGIPTVDVVMTVLHAGGKFEEGAYQVSGGLHGVGVSVVNALSTRLEADIRKDGSEWFQTYDKSVPGTLRQGEPTKETGTTIRFWADPDIFETTSYDFETIARRLQEMAFLNKGLTIELTDERVSADEVVDEVVGDTAAAPKTADEKAAEATVHKVKHRVFHYPGGLVDFVKHINRTKTAIQQSIIDFEGKGEGHQVEIAMQWNAGYSESVHTFANTINTHEGGTHEEGFRAAMTTYINKYAREKGLLKEKDDNLTGDDIREGLTAVISVKLSEPQFEGQTKTKLGNTEAKAFVQKVVGDQLTDWLDRNPAQAKRVIMKAVDAATARLAARKARETARRKSVFESFSMPEKLKDCTSKDPSISEIFLVEGDSAGGSAVSGRDPERQAILSLRGKILNVEKARLDRALGNAEIQAMISAFGTGIGEDFDVEKARYHKIVLMADADVDGQHITTLLLTLLFRYMRGLIEAGYVYLAMPPLFRLKWSNSPHEYVYSDRERDALLAAGLEEGKRIPKDNGVQRYKGLGEMNAKELWETTMDPETRTLRQVTIDDAAAADEIFSILMGEDVESRRGFIQRNAKDVRFLDI